jgi:nucleoside-diphosphate-sugar epimerase
MRPALRWVSSNQWKIQLPDLAGLSGKKILVTGASGFIGRRLVEKLALAGVAEVTALVRNSNKARPLQSSGVQTCLADLSKPMALDQAVPGHDTVINLAHDFKRSGKHNLRNFDNLVNACLRHGVRNIVHTSSIVVYDDWPAGDVNEESSSGGPGTDYKNTKAEIEKRLLAVSHTESIHSTILQPTIVYGPYSWLWTDHVAEKLLHGKLILPSDCEGICHAIYVDDVADALLLAAIRQGPSGEKFIISGHSPPTWREYYERHNRLLGKNAIEYVDRHELAKQIAGTTGSAKSYISNPLLLANLKPIRGILNSVERVLGDGAINYLKSGIRRVGGVGPIVYFPTGSELQHYCSAGRCDIAKAERVLDYTPRFDFDSGFELTARYLKRKLGGI